MLHLLQQSVAFSSYWLPVFLFIATQSIVLGTMVYRNGIDQAKRNAIMETEIKFLTEMVKDMQYKLDNLQN